MKSKKTGEGQFYLRVDLGEEIAQTLTAFLKKEGIRSGSIRGIGAAKDVELGFLDMETKQYLRKTISEDLEILSLSGNVSVKEGQPFLHLHGVFSDREFKVHGGHFFKGTVSCTGEFFLHGASSEPVMRRARPDLGFFEQDL